MNVRMYKYMGTSVGAFVEDLCKLRSINVSSELSVYKIEFEIKFYLTLF